MIIKKYGIELERLRQEDIELVREMRNREDINNKMFYRKEISREEQKKWFKSINNHYNYYYLVTYKEKKIGLIHGKILSFEYGIAEGGLFIWDLAYQNSHLPIIASVCLADITFLIMKMKKTLADVRMDNKKAIDYNLKMGYETVEKIEEEQRLKMELTKENYFEKAGAIRQMVKKISGDPKDISWDDMELTKGDPHRLYTGLPGYLQEKIDEKRAMGLG